MVVLAQLEQPEAVAVQEMAKSAEMVVLVLLHQLQEFQLHTQVAVAVLDAQQTEQAARAAAATVAIQRQAAQLILAVAVAVTGIPTGLRHTAALESL